MSKTRNKIGRRTDLSGRVRFFDMISIGIGDLGYSIISCTVATYIVTFGTMALPGVSKNSTFDFSVLMAIAVGIAVLFDAVSDPIMGFISDHFNSKKFGKRHLFMLIGLIGMMATALAVWYIPYQKMNAGGTFVWFTIFLILIRTFNTMYYTPMSAFTTEISTDYNERTKIQTVRSILYVIGMLLPVLLMASFQNKYAGVYRIGALSEKWVNPFTLQPLEHYKNIDIYIDLHRKELMQFISTQSDTSELLVYFNGKEIITPIAVKEYLDQFGLEFRSGNMIAAGYQVFSIVATAICVVTSAFFLLQSRIHIPLVRKREEQEAEAKGIDLNAKPTKYTMQQCREELIAQGNPNPTRKEMRTLLREKRAAAGQVTVGAIFRNFFGAFKVKEMRVLALGYVTAMMSATLIISLGFNVFTFTFRLTTTQMYVLMGALLAMTIGFQPAWAALAKKKSKHFSMFTGLIISFVGCCLLFLMFLLRNQINAILLDRSTSWWGVVIMAPSLMIAGAGTGVLYSMPLALVGDVVVLQKDLTGEDKTGTYSGVMTFCYKIGQGIMTTVSTMLLAAVGFESGQSWQTQKASDGIGWILCIGVVIFVGAGIAIFSQLKLDRKKITEILERDNQKGLHMDDAPTETEELQKIAAETVTEEAAMDEAAASEE